MESVNVLSEINMKKPIITRSGLIVVGAFAVVAIVAGFFIHTRSWYAYERHWHKAVAFAPEIKRLLQSDPAYRSVGSSAYQIGGPAEIKVMGTLESRTQLAELKNRIKSLNPPIPIEYEIIVTDLLRQGRRLVADLANQGLEPSHWVINPATNGTFGLVYRSQNIKSIQPLSGKPVYWLEFHDSPVADLSPLQGLPLERLVFDRGAVEHGLDVIRKMNTIRQINGMPTEAFWRQQKEREQNIRQVSSESALSDEPSM